MVGALSRQRSVDSLSSWTSSDDEAQTKAKPCCPCLDIFRRRSGATRGYRRVPTRDGRQSAVRPESILEMGSETCDTLSVRTADDDSVIDDSQSEVAHNYDAADWVECLQVSASAPFREPVPLTGRSNMSSLQQLLGAGATSAEAILRDDTKRHHVSCYCIFCYCRKRVLHVQNMSDLVEAMTDRAAVLSMLATVEVCRSKSTSVVVRRDTTQRDYVNAVRAILMITASGDELNRLLKALHPLSSLSWVVTVLLSNTGADGKELKESVPAASFASSCGSNSPLAPTASASACLRVLRMLLHDSLLFPLQRLQHIIMLPWMERNVMLCVDPGSISSHVLSSTLTGCASVRTLVVRYRGWLVANPVIRPEQPLDVEDDSVSHREMPKRSGQSNTGRIQDIPKFGVQFLIDVHLETEGYTVFDAEISIQSVAVEVADLVEAPKPAAAPVLHMGSLHFPPEDAPPAPVPLKSSPSVLLSVWNWVTRGGSRDCVNTVSQKGFAVMSTLNKSKGWKRRVRQLRYKIQSHFRVDTHFVARLE